MSSYAEYKPGGDFVLMDVIAACFELYGIRLK